ncbi:MAG TPA: lantibiotic dehydratase [Longimicrobium sp.]|nr:lantibiotic dehydratase [Longimicrobium sp.]
MPRTPTAQLLARICGLPADVLNHFTTRLCEALPQRDTIAAELERARAALEDAIFAAVPGADPALRRFLLAVKRDCHNARPLARHAAAPAWEILRLVVGDGADEVIRLEARLEEWDAQFAAAFATERDRQRQALYDTLADREFVRGLALASSDLARALQGTRGAPAEATRRDERAETALLRYVTRAAIKVSPFSTLTTVGLGTLGRDAGPAGLELRGPWRARSVIRLKRFLLDQAVFFLLRHPPFRDRLPLALNDSATEVEPGRFLFLRPGRWELDGEGGTLRYHAEALVRTGIAGPVDDAARDAAARGVTLPELLHAVVAQTGESAETVGARVERLLDLGYLEHVLPWPAQSARLERQILAHLRTLPGNPALDAFVAELDAVVRLQDGHAAAADPAASLAELERRIHALRRAAGALGGADPEAAATGGPTEFHLYEDVFVSARRAGAPAPVLRMSRAAADEAIRNAMSLVRVSALFDRRHEFVLTLGAWARRQWPGARRVGALELFHSAQPLWREYSRFHARWWKEKDPTLRWNPLELPEIDELDDHRARVFAELRGAAVAGVDENRVDPARLEALLDGVPAAWTSADAWGACLLLQPASEDGSLWMLSRVKEGTGRYAARYTAAMEPAARRGWTRNLARRGAFMLHGEPAELLDAGRPQGDTLNVHAAQTPRVLALPGERPGVSPSRQLRLDDVWMCLEGEGAPTLRDSAGVRLLPVHLGMAFEVYMPQLVRFLTAFGPNELGGVFPAQPSFRNGDVVTAPRTVMGNLVLHRRWWSVPLAPLAEAVRGGDAQALARVDRLRRAWGLPAQAFFSEPQSNFFFGTVSKPQYLDFTSPLFLPLLRAALEKGGERLRLYELLPTPALCPRDAEGRPRALEVVLDTAALRRPAAAAARAGTAAMAAGG